VTQGQLRDILSSMAQSTALAAHGVSSHDSYFPQIDAADTV
jgi:hypothetical protein